MEKKVRNYTSTCTRQFRIIWLANKGLIYWSVWCNGESTRAKKNICLIAIRTGGAGMAKLVHFNNFFYLLECDIVESWNGTRMNQTTPERRSRKNSSDKWSFFHFFALFIWTIRFYYWLLTLNAKKKVRRKRRNRNIWSNFKLTSCCRRRRSFDFDYYSTYWNDDNDEVDDEYERTFECTFERIDRVQWWPIMWKHWNLIN